MKKTFICTECDSPIDGDALIYKNELFHKKCGTEVKDKDDGVVVCRKCKGSGKNEYLDEGSFSYQIDGRGTPPQLHSDKCEECNGIGKIKGEYVEVVTKKTILKKS